MMGLRILRTRFLATICFAMFVFFADGYAQSEQKPYSFTDVVLLVRGGVGANVIVSKAKAACISFRLTARNLSRLRAEGADATIIEGLRAACYRGPADEGDESSRRRDVPEKVVVKHDTVVVRDSVRTGPQVWFDIRFDGSVSDTTYPGCEVRRSDQGAKVTSLSDDVDCAVWGGQLPLPPDVVIEASATLLSGGENAVVLLSFGRERAGFYMFGVGADGTFGLLRWQSESHHMEPLLPFRPAAAIRKGVGATNKLKVMVAGFSITLFVNDVEVAAYTASRPAAGFATMGLLGATGTGAIRVSDFRAVGLNHER